jgi:hypothetical protein
VLFFEGEIMAVKKPPDRAGRERSTKLAAEQFAQFDQRDINLGLDRGQDHVAVGFDVM